MEIKITTKQVLNVLYILSWILFFGICIEAGGFIFNTLYSLFFSQESAQHFWKEVDLSSLYKFDTGHFSVMAGYIVIVSVLKAIMFYLIVQLLHDKKLDMARPFNSGLRKFISNISYLAFGIGLFSLIGKKYGYWLAGQGVAMPTAENMGMGGADVWVFMAVILFVIAHVLKRGTELQDEHELTI